MFWTGDFEISADSHYVIPPIAALTGVADLYSAPITGGEAKRLFQDIYHDSEEPYLLSYKISENSQQVVTTLSSGRLKSVPIGGGDPILLSTSSGIGFSISPDGRRVFYPTLRPSPGPSTQLFTVPVSGGPSELIKPPLSSPPPYVYFHQICPNAQHVVFRARQSLLYRELSITHHCLSNLLKLRYAKAIRNTTRAIR